MADTKDLVAVYKSLAAAVGEEEARRVWRRVPKIAALGASAVGRQRGQTEYNLGHLSVLIEGFRALATANGWRDKELFRFLARHILRDAPFGVLDAVRPGPVVAKKRQLPSEAALIRAMQRAAKLPVPQITQHGEAAVARIPADGGVSEVVVRFGRPSRQKHKP